MIAVTPSSVQRSMHRSQRTGLRHLAPPGGRAPRGRGDHGAVAVGDQRDAGVGDVVVGPARPQLADGGLHEVGVERAGDLERDDAGPGRRVGGEGGECVEGAGGDDLAGAVDVGRGEVVARRCVASTSSGSPPSTALMPVGVAALACAIARPRWATKRMASVSVSTPAAAAAVISPTECPARAPVPAGAGVAAVAVLPVSARRASSPAPTSSGWATAVSLMVSSSDVVPWVTRSTLGGVGQCGQLVAQAGQLEPRGEEARGLGALAGADDDDHVLQPVLPTVTFS